MGMVVRTNIMATNSNNNLTKNNSALSKSLEKLSSGFRINRAADDASGLAISEKMKAQIKALDTASANCEDGISLIQTAEGYMTEIHDMLNRMVELAEKSANGTMETVSGGTSAEVYSGAATDRQALQEEMDQLCAEIDRIAQTANFNNLKLFDGTLDGAGTAGSPAVVASATGSLPGNATMAFDPDAVASSITEDATIVYDGSDWKVGSDTVSLADYGITVTDDDGDLVDGTTIQFTAAKAEVLPTDGSGAGLTLQIGETDTAADKLVVNVAQLTTDKLFDKIAEGTTYTGTGTGLELTQNNATSTYDEGLTVNISNQDAASSAAVGLRNSINAVSSQRAKLGAMQNRMEYTINNLNTASENMNSANSRIRDTDMAKEMMKYTQSNVLTQAAQAMLAQANTQPQNVLQLLQ